MSGHVEFLRPFKGVEVFVAEGEFPTHDMQREAVYSLFGIAEPRHRLCHRSDGAPFLLNSSRHVSVSHSRQAVAVALSSDGPVGIDVESYSPKLERVAGRFLTHDEQLDVGRSSNCLIRAWTFKEAAFKLLQWNVERPAVITELDIYMAGISSFTSHRSRYALTVCRQLTIVR